MAKVIVDRSMDGDMPMRLDCGRCKSTVEYESDDVKKGEFGGAWCERGDIKLYVKCPVCGGDQPLTDTLVARVPVARKRELGWRF